MTKRTTIAIALVAVLAAGTALAQAKKQDEDRPGRGSADGPRFERLAERLDLTDEQKTALEAIRKETREKNLALDKEIRRLRNELEGELLKDDPSLDKVLQINGKLGELKTEQQGNRLASRLAVRKQLTPEQRDKMLAWGDHRGPRGDGFGRGPGEGRGHGPGRGRGQCRCDGSCGAQGPGRGVR